MTNRRLFVTQLVSLPLLLLARGAAAEATTNHRSKLTRTMLGNYDMLVIVNKADPGQWMQVRHKPESGSWSSYREWPISDHWKVSTGREKQEDPYFTHTPTGIFDIGSKFVQYYTTDWDGAEMPYAMFLKQKIGPKPEAIAIHGTRGKNASKLGARASGGCIRLGIPQASALFRKATKERKRILVVVDLIRV